MEYICRLLGYTSEYNILYKTLGTSRLAFETFEKRFIRLVNSQLEVFITLTGAVPLVLAIGLVKTISIAVTTICRIS